MRPPCRGEVQSHVVSFSHPYSVNLRSRITDSSMTCGSGRLVDGLVDPAGSFLGFSFSVFVLFFSFSLFLLTFAFTRIGRQASRRSRRVEVW